MQNDDELSAFRQHLDPAQLKEAVPKTSFWSDIVWAQWVEICQHEGVDPANLKYVFRNHITNSDTTYIMEQAVDRHTPHGFLDVPWPGKDFSLVSLGGVAILGTVHGQGPVRLLYDHRHQIPRKTIQKIMVWTVGSAYYLLFTLD